MKSPVWIGIGLVVLILGILSFFVPIPRNEHDGVKIGGVSIGIETRHDEKAPPILGAAMILAGAGLMFAAKAKG